MGNAAFIPRPHTAASASKAAADAIALAEALADRERKVPQALKEWERDRLALGMYLWKRGQSLGDRSQCMYGRERSEEAISR